MTRKRLVSRKLRHPPTHWKHVGFEPLRAAHGLIDVVLPDVLNRFEVQNTQIQHQDNRKIAGNEMINSFNIKKSKLIH